MSLNEKKNNHIVTRLQYPMVLNIIVYHLLYEPCVIQENLEF